MKTPNITNQNAKIQILQLITLINIFFIKNKFKTLLNIGIMCTFASQI